MGSDNSTALGLQYNYWSDQMSSSIGLYVLHVLMHYQDIISCFMGLPNLLKRRMDVWWE